MIQIADLPTPLISFGTDAAGEVYILTIGGPVHRLVDADDESGLPLTIPPNETAVPPNQGDG